MTERPVAVVTGANRGIGLEVARQLVARGVETVLTARDPARARAAAERIGAAHGVVDVADDGSVDRFQGWLRDRYGTLHVLVNNAGGHYDAGQDAVSADLAVVGEALAVNLLGAWRVCRALLPLMAEGGRVVNVSSGAGSFAETAGAAGTPAYAVSKAALNMLTVKLAAELRHRRIAVNAVCPGWVATDMGGAGGRPVADGAAGVVWAATLGPDAPTGGFFRDGHPIPW
ncbi:SDR family NAD(P)-dependent oxidoreductase [Micromonospora sp. CPCC 205711]|uniref:SDR family NAD(P)-dependent oxidoreductase n=1 Tax=Micromonospora sp. CPCC 205547 TaxID=3122400 RepID=UPI002FEFA375